MREDINEFIALSENTKLVFGFFQKISYLLENHMLFADLQNSFDNQNIWKLELKLYV